LRNWRIDRLFDEDIAISGLRSSRRKTEEDHNGGLGSGAPSSGVDYIAP